MNWTTTKPSKPGWYWWRSNPDCDAHPTEIINLAGSLEVCGDWWPWEYSDMSHGEWSSEPIPEPTEREERGTQP